jgi:hypothetical protein
MFSIQMQIDSWVEIDFVEDFFDAIYIASSLCETIDENKLRIVKDGKVL